jgi:branched-chain amino acid transport system permease protein
MTTAVAILVDGLIYASWLFLVALGLTLTFGVMKILNIAHGNFYAIGAYAAASAVGAYVATGWAAAGVYLAMAGAASVAGLVLGYGLERGLLRFMYDRDEILILLVTYAVFLMLDDVMLLVWGATAYDAYQPDVLLGTTTIRALPYPNYDLSLIAVAAAIGGGLWWALSRTRRGKMLTAVIHDREMSTFLGIDVATIFTVTFTLGAILGAIGGALTAPIISVQPGIGAEVIVLAFAVVVIGGMGSILGALVGSVAAGLAHAAAVHLFPQGELFVIYAVMSLVLIARPQGLFGQPAPRKI